MCKLRFAFWSLSLVILGGLDIFCTRCQTVCCTNKNTTGNYTRYRTHTWLINHWIITEPCSKSPFDLTLFDEQVTWPSFFLTQPSLLWPDIVLFFYPTISGKVNGISIGVMLDGWRNILITFIWKNTWKYPTTETTMRYTYFSVT